MANLFPSIRCSADNCELSSSVMGCSGQLFRISTFSRGSLLGSAEKTEERSAKGFASTYAGALTSD